MSVLDTAAGRVLASLIDGGRLRRLRRVEPAGGPRLRIDGREVVDFSSNDYLGLRGHPVLVERAAEWALRWGAGAGASRLVTGNLVPFEAVESKVAAAKGAEAALLFASGFQAGATLLPALLDPVLAGSDPMVFTDRLVHASLHHGLRAAGVRQTRYRHGDLDHLEHLLRASAGRPGTRFVITETVFSMDGDRTDVPALVELADRHGAFLYLDEAHATGVLGPDGFGLAAGLADRAGLVMGTFSKALGGFGAYAVCSARLRDYLVNRCAGLIYSTGLPPAVLGAMDAALDLVPTLAPERARLAAHSARMRTALRGAGLDTGRSDTQIVPVLLGEEARALAVAAALQDRGLLGMAIRPPTVPPGTSRIRFTLSAAHDDAQVGALIDAVVDVARAEETA